MATGISAADKLKPIVAGAGVGAAGGLLLVSRSDRSLPLKVFGVTVTAMAGAALGLLFLPLP